MRKRMKRWNWTLAGILISLILVSCMLGKYELSFADIMLILIGKAENQMDTILFFQIRLSRTFFVVLSGGILSLAGITYQTVFQNPLASPDILGVSNGCSVGAVLAILGFSSSVFAAEGLTFSFGIGTVILSIFLSQLFGGDKKYRMILSGMVVGAIANSILMTLKYTADPNRELPAIEYWLMGSFQSANWEQVKRLFLLSFPAAIFLYFLRWKLKVLALGEEEAQGLGISVNRVRILALFSATVFVSGVVSAAGIVSWIGLIAPHLIRIWMGNDYERNFTPSFFMGGILLLSADICARTFFAAELPISILTSFFGAILLILLLWREKRQRTA